MGTVGAQYGQVSSSSWGTVEALLGQKAQYGHSLARFSIGTVWAQSGHERVNFQKKFRFQSFRLRLFLLHTFFSPRLSEFCFRIKTSFTG